MKSSTRGPLNSTLRSSAAASAGKSSSSSSASASKSKSSSSSSASSTRGARAAAAGNNNNNNQSSPNVGSSGRSRAARDRSGGNGDRDRVRDRSGADRASDRGGGGDQDSTAKSARQDGKPKEQLKDLTLDDVNPDFTTWQIPDLARYRRAVKMHHPAPRPIRPPTSPGIAHMRLRLPASAQFLLPNDPDAGDDKSMDVDTTTPTYAKPPPKLVSIQGLDAARALLRPTHQIDLAEYAMRHYYTAAKIPLLDAPPSAESSSLQQQQQQQQPPVMVHPRAEAETILYFVYSSRFNRYRNLQLPMADAALMIREVREGKFATTLSMPASAAAASTSSGATTTSAAALRARQAAAGLSGAGPFSVGPAGPGQVGGTLVLRGAGSESERGQPVHGAAVSRSQPHHQASGSSSRYVHAAHGHHVQQHHHQQVQQQYHPQQQQQVAAARGYGHHPEQHPPQGYQHPHPHHPGHAQQHHQQAARGQHGRA